MLDQIPFSSQIIVSAPTNWCRLLQANWTMAPTLYLPGLVSSINRPLKGTAGGGQSVSEMNKN